MKKHSEHPHKVVIVGSKIAGTINCRVGIHFVCVFCNEVLLVDEYDPSRERLKEFENELATR